MQSKLAVAITALAVAFVAITTLASQSSGQNLSLVAGARYVDAGSIGGKCSNTYTLAQNNAAHPWCSIATAFTDTASSPGATVYVRGGTYSTSVVVPSYAPTSNVTFQAYPGDSVAVHGLDIGSATKPSKNFTFSGFTFGQGAVQITNASAWTIENSTIAITPVAPSTCPIKTIGCTPQAIALTPPMSDASILHNTVTNCSVGVLFRLGASPSTKGVPVTGTSTNTTFQRVAINNNTFRGCGNFVISAQNFAGLQINGNTFANDVQSARIDPTCHCDAVHLIGGGYNFQVNNNLVYGGRGFLVQPGLSTGVATNGVNCQPRCLEMDDGQIANNRLVGIDFAIRVYTAPGIRILNNTIQTPTGVDDGLTFGNTPPDPTTGAVVANNVLSELEVLPHNTMSEDYNLVQDRVTGRIPGCVSSAANCTYLNTAGPHDVSGTPKFASPGPPNYNYTLVPGSPGYRGGLSSLSTPSEPGDALSAQPNMGAFGGEAGLTSGSSASGTQTVSPTTTTSTTRSSSSGTTSDSGTSSDTSTTSSDTSTTSDTGTSSDTSTTSDGGTSSDTTTTSDSQTSSDTQTSSTTASTTSS